MTKHIFSTTGSGEIGYECSSRGDKRFSALFARLSDGRTIEEHYQCDIKGYDPGGTDWRLGKGNRPLTPMDPKEQYEKYKALWKKWAKDHKDLMKELRKKAEENFDTLKDSFGTTTINQARALADILNERKGAKGKK